MNEGSDREGRRNGMEQEKTAERGEQSHYTSMGSAGSECRAPEMPSWQCLLSDPSMLADLGLAAPHSSARQPGAVESLPYSSSRTLASVPHRLSLTLRLLPRCADLTLAQGWNLQSDPIVCFCNITGSLQNPRQSHFQPLAPENLAPALFERVDCVIFTMSLPEHFT
ncbi:hypothetical protein SRHO_G00052140 [Serrasalmus rhombeus]